MAPGLFPFGMMMPGREYQAQPSRFGFNGKENDHDVKGFGNQQDYGMRIYDARLGRFYSMDPLAGDFPWYSPYQFAGNMPIWAIDLDGAEERLIGDRNLKYWSWRQAGASHEKANTMANAYYGGTALGSVIAMAILTAEFTFPYLIGGSSGGAIWLSNPSNQHLVSQIAGFTLEILNPDPNSLPINFPGEGDEIAKGVEVLFKQFKVPELVGKSRFILNTERFKYYFDKLDYRDFGESELKELANSIGQTVEKLTNNILRSKSMSAVFEKWGVKDNKKGLEWLADAFEKGLNSAIISQRTESDGTISIMRSVNVINTKTQEVIGNIEIGYLYRNGDLNSVPEIGTVIPKDHTKKVK